MEGVLQSRQSGAVRPSIEGLPPPAFVDPGFRRNDGKKEISYF
jgi:hypothetical protein